VNEKKGGNKIKNRKFILIFILFVLWAPTSFAWFGKVVSVVDGDTVKVLRDGKQIKIRLYGIDTPEKSQAYGKKAKQFTADMTAGKKVEIESIDRDRYGRIVGLVTVKGKSLNKELVKAGYAWVYRQYCKKSFCRELILLESEAKKNGRGLFKEKNPVTPWDWRRGSKKVKRAMKGNIRTSSFHGNVKSRVFHNSSCKYYDCKSCTAFFSNREKAVQAGFRPCKICSP
jgi:endonuclease YncB( thermonuclease family)